MAENFCSETRTNFKAYLGGNKTLQEVEGSLNLHNQDDDGSYSPQNCLAITKTAIVVPYRDRGDHLSIFLLNMHKFLRLQKIAYQIFLVEPISNQIFNRAKLMNIGFVESQKIGGFNCTVFHDVDLIPLNGSILYNCSSLGPMHLSSAYDKYKFKMPYWDFFGGVMGFTTEQMEKINGFSNNFWGWGGEDDEISERIGRSNQTIQRYSTEIGRYAMLRHNRDALNPEINLSLRLKQIQKSAEHWATEGLSSLLYAVVKIERRKLFTRILVDTLPPNGNLKSMNGVA